MKTNPILNLEYTKLDNSVEVLRFVVSSENNKIMILQPTAIKSLGIKKKQKQSMMAATEDDEILKWLLA